jgi:hypothetical protein
LRGSFICLIPRLKRGVLDYGMKERPGLAKRFYIQARTWMSARAAARLLEREGKLLLFGSALSGVAVETAKSRLRLVTLRSGVTLVTLRSGVTAAGCWLA